MICKVFDRFARSHGALATLAFAVAGCGSGDLGTVSGKVTLHGQPLKDATVIFSPVAGGAPSAGKTDENGEYHLAYSRKAKGAEIGQHRVWISTQQSADPDMVPPTPARPEQVPPPFRRPQGATAEVAGGTNELDFDLDAPAASISAVPNSQGDGRCE